MQAYSLHSYTFIESQGFTLISKISYFSSMFHEPCMYVWVREACGMYPANVQQPDSTLARLINTLTKRLRHREIIPLGLKVP